MCGITGILNQSDKAIVSRMARSIAHRGPDGLDWITTENASLGASRLAIAGNSQASAIFHDEQTNIRVLLNGEIYNVDALRAELLIKGFSIKTDLESEVIANLYRLHGLNFPKYLKGMFAIAILDGDRLVLARDRFGIKPMYYSIVGDRVIFGSEIKSILAYPGFVARLHIPALEETAVFGYISSSEKTLFQDILQVKPGTVLTFLENKQSEISFSEMPDAQYFDQIRHQSFSAARTQLRDLIIDTIDMLFSHGSQPKGIYLSGGIDSTILAFVARSILGYPVTTFTLADSTESPDFLAAREVAKKLGTTHIEHIVSVKDYFNELDHFVEHYESLVAGGVFDIHGGMAFHLLSKVVSEHVKVAFSGEGADELFGGYYWVYTHPLGFSDRIRSRLAACRNGSPLKESVERLFPLPEDERVYRLNLFNALVKGGLANYHLQSVDRSAGAFGFEIRPAYLYDDLATFALNLPIDYKVPDKNTTKWILREAFRPELERLGLGWVTTRLKEGMPAAVANLAPLISERMESSISDSTLAQHPLRDYLKSKMDIFLFYIFARTFLPEMSYAA